MPLLIIPLAFLILMALWVVLLPVSIWQRYRLGRSRRLARPWLVGFNAWFLLATVVVFLAINAIANVWFPHNLLQAFAGMLIGMLLGVLALWTSRYEWQPQGLFHTPNPWLILLLTLLVAGRIVLSVVQIARQGAAWWSGHALDADWHAGIVALAGLLLGYALAYQWGLRHRLRRMRRV